ncbi:MAG: hypothetical protein HS111_23415 [Kofleriaceae bacterium]|nr:hypothetical protein [Kofleriaceae bacterium]
MGDAVKRPGVGPPRLDHRLDRRAVVVIGREGHDLTVPSNGPAAVASCSSQALSHAPAAPGSPTTASVTVTPPRAGLHHAGEEARVVAILERAVDACR